MRSDMLFQTWWHALAAVPSNQAEVDWWAASEGRHTRYERLFRAWSDPTDSLPPPFYRLTKEKHLVPALWENFALFDPAAQVAALYKQLDFTCSGDAIDACWSCEFNLGHQDRQLDLVIHIRFAQHDEVVVAEAKANNKAFDKKDLDAEDALGRQQFQFAQMRRYFLIGDAAPPAGWQSLGYGCMSWGRMCDLQLFLCECLPESEVVKNLMRRLIATQFFDHGIFSSFPSLVTPAAELEKEVKNSMLHISTERCRGFAASAVQHLRCLVGLKPNAWPFSYLRREPSVHDVKPGWREGCGRRTVNETPFWKLPPRS